MTATAKPEQDEAPKPVPLGADEISHLIQTAQSESYRVSEDAPRKETGSFKPKSLMDLARAASMKEPEPAVDEVSPEPKAEPEIEIIAPNEAAADPEEYAEAGIEELPQEQIIPEQDDDPTPEEVPQPIEPPAPANVVDTEMLEKIRAEAFEAGQAEARREDTERQKQAIDALEAAAQALIAPSDAAMRQLRASIETSVKQLASARAGIAIDECPEHFLSRIEDLADRVHASMAAPVLRLNPDDLDAVSDFVAQSEILSEMRMVASPDLAPGDVELTLDGLALMDRIEPLVGRRRRVAASSRGRKKTSSDGGVASTDTKE